MLNHPPYTPTKSSLPTLVKPNILRLRDIRRSFDSSFVNSALVAVSTIVSSALVTLPAKAQGASSGGGSLIQGLMPILLIFAVMYFLLIRPQQKRQRQHRELVAQLKRGDKVLTSGGLYASVVRPIDDRDIEIEIAGKLRVKMVRTSVIELVSSSPPASTKKNVRKKL